LAIVEAVLCLIVIVRFGLLASVIMFFVYLMLVLSPLTHHLKIWYALSSMVPLLTTTTLLILGFRAALGRKPFFGRRILEA